MGRLATTMSLAALAIAGCAAPAPPIVPPTPAPPIAAAPPPTAPAPPPPALSLLAEDHALPDLAAAPVEAPPLDRAFERVPLPADLPPIVGVDGRDEGDVWLVGAQGEEVVILRWDGARVVKEKPPRCRSRVEYAGMVMMPEGPVAVARSYEEEGAGTRIESRRRPRGGWSCEKKPDGQLLAVAGEALRMDWRKLSVGGRPLPTPSLFTISWSDVEVAARSAADLWLYFPGHGEVLHGNGVGWELRPTGLTAVKSLRVDDRGAPWLVGTREGEGEGGVLLRWDLEARRWKRLPAPADLGGARIRVRNERDVWVLGKEHVHHWDGATLRRGKMPVDWLGAAWVSPGGELWVVGGDASSPPPKRSAVGVAFRVRPAPPPGAKP